MKQPKDEGKAKKFRYICTTHRDRVQHVNKCGLDGLTYCGYWLLDGTPIRMYQTSPSHRGRCEVCGQKTDSAFSNTAYLGEETNQNEEGTTLSII